jgi:hypothetical protein
MKQPEWLPEAVLMCPDKAAELKRAVAELDAFPKDAATDRFIALYERMLQVREEIYEAWLELQS